MKSYAIIIDMVNGKSLELYSSILGRKELKEKVKLLKEKNVIIKNINTSDITNIEVYDVDSGNRVYI